MPYPEAIKDLKILFSSFHSLVVIETAEEDRAAMIATRAGNESGLKTYKWSIAQGIQPQEYEFTKESSDPKILLSTIKERKQKSLYILKELSSHLSDPKTLRLLKEASGHCAAWGSTILLLESNAKMPPELESEVVYYQVRMPTRDDYRKLVQNLLQDFKGATPKIELSKADADKFLDSLAGLTLKQARQMVAYCLAEDGKLSNLDIERVLERKTKLIQDSGALDFYPVKGESYKLGGFKNLKSFLTKTEAAFTEQARQMKLPWPKGILVVGVPGCGKSLTAKFIAQHWKMPLLKLDTGKMFDKYIGESEKNFRRAVELAEAMAPSVLWIDEMEKMIGTGGSADSSDGGLSKRIFGSLLTWLQEKRTPVYVVATANNLSEMPPELLRKGRFDEVFFVDLPTAQEREEIFNIHLELRSQTLPQGSMIDLIQATEGFSGAEIEQVVIGALMRSIHSQRPVTASDVFDEIQSTRPLSVSKADEIRRLRQMAKNQFVPV